MSSLNEIVNKIKLNADNLRNMIAGKSECLPMKFQYNYINPDGTTLEIKDDFIGCNCPNYRQYNWGVSTREYCSHINEFCNKIKNDLEDVSSMGTESSAWKTRGQYTSTPYRHLLGRPFAFTNYIPNADEECCSQQLAGLMYLYELLN